VRQAELSVAVLYVPEAHRVHVAPPSLVPYPALHVPALLPEQLVAFDEQVVHTVFPLIVLYVPDAHAVQEGVVATVLPPYPAAQVPALLPPQPIELAVQSVHPVFPAAVL